jgi:hypothetical protein
VLLASLTEWFSAIGASGSAVLGLARGTGNLHPDREAALERSDAVKTPGQTALLALGKPSFLWLHSLASLAVSTLAEGSIFEDRGTAPITADRLTEQALVE